MISNFLRKCKDGEDSSTVDTYFLIEIKFLFSIALLRFNKGRREAFHTHAFNAYTWFLKGELLEEDVDGSLYAYTRKILPKATPKINNHRVLAIKDSWCLTVRGPWQGTWTEYNKALNKSTLFTHGRKIIRAFTGK